MADLESTAIPARVLLLERDVRLRERVQQHLVLAGLETVVAGSVTEAAERLADAACDLALVELAAAGMDGVAGLLRAPGLAAHGQLFAGVAAEDGAAARVAALRIGVSGCLPHPYEPDEVLLVLERAARAGAVARERASLRAALGDQAEILLVGRSPAAQRLRELVARAAAQRGSILLLGEPGTGRELVARTIHALSDRAARPFRVLECRGRDAASLEQELFGPTEGSSAGAFGPRGLLAEAAGGMLLLDGAPALPAPLQARLARMLQERATSDVRLVATAREDELPAFSRAESRGHLDALVHSAGFTIVVPPLRDRRSDIPLLVAHFRARFERDTGTTAPPVAPEVLSSFLGYDWPGNVRQLEQQVARLLLLPAGTRPLATLASELAARGGALGPLDAASSARWSLAELERAHILRVLDQEGGHQSRAAEVLGIDRRTLYRKLRQYRREDASAERGAPAPPPRVRAIS